MPTYCAQCGKKLGFWSVVVVDNEKYCEKCAQSLSKKEKNLSSVPVYNHKEKKSSKTAGIKVATWIAAIIIVFMGLIPPWTGIIVRQGTIYKNSAGYSSIFSPPELRNDPLGRKVDMGMEIDTTRLFIQWFVVIVAWGAVYISQRKQ